MDLREHVRLCEGKSPIVNGHAFYPAPKFRALSIMRLVSRYVDGKDEEKEPEEPEPRFRAVD